MQTERDRQEGKQSRERGHPQGVQTQKCETNKKNDDGKETSLLILRGTGLLPILHAKQLSLLLLDHLLDLRFRLAGLAAPAAAAGSGKRRRIGAEPIIIFFRIGIGRDSCSRTMGEKERGGVK
jgi:hypothetical protein